MYQYLFVDTNVLIDFLDERKPFIMDATKIFEAADKGKIKLYVASFSFNNIFYLMQKSKGRSKTFDILLELETLVEIIPIDRTVIAKALRSDFKDFEDALQNFCAEAEPNVQAIITRNEKDFRKSALPVLSPGAIVNLL